MEKTKRWKVTLPSLIVIQSASTFLLNKTLSPVEFVSCGMILALFAFISLWLRPSRSFLILVALMSFMGLVLIIVAWRYRWPASYEIRWISNHFLIGVLTTSLWLQSVILHTIVNAYKSVLVELKRLRKLDELTGVLTLNEFLYRLEDLVVGMYRRGEIGYLLVVTITPQQGYLSKSVLSQIGRIAVHSVRGKYDLVGRIGSDKLAIALQNTDERGAHLVEERFLGALERQLAHVHELLHIQRVPIEGSWPQVRKALVEHSLIPYDAIEGAQ